MKLQNPLVALTLEMHSNVGDDRHGPEFGTGELAQRVEEELIENCVEKMHGGLQIKVSYSCQSRQPNIGWTHKAYDACRQKNRERHCRGLVRYELRKYRHDHWKLELLSVEANVRA